MQLAGLLEHMTYQWVRGDKKPEISGICYHSGKVQAGTLFVCIKGQNADGSDYLWDVMAAGAAAVVIEESSIIHGETDTLSVNGITVIAVQDARKALAEVSAAFFDFPAKKLKMVGITGTKGKTTTAFLTAGILREAGIPTGMIGTVWIDNGREIRVSDHTTPEAYEVQCYLAEMVENGCQCCVMEVSSQGIAMKRVEGIIYDIGIFLNIEPDHIGKGEHATFSEYLHCKSRLFRQCRLGIVNRDDPNTDRILRGHTCKVAYFSTRHPAEVWGEQEKFYMIQGRLYSCFRAGKQEKQGEVEAEEFQVQMQLPGRFNIENAVAAIAVAFQFEVKIPVIQRALRHQTVPGRCENVSHSESYVLLIDYAHNEMSLKNLLETLREFEPGRLVVLFGCGGNRSKLRRTHMGETAGRIADLTILTSDNPRWEEPEQIIDDIEEGIQGTGGAYMRISDRKEAVRYVVSQAQEGDIIVLAGKGHEAYQEICGIKYPVSDYELAAEAMAGRLETAEEIH
jgi:UDP-N-acetylmuramoyl-L-alanyl-D-glutamate--2,6-diaminopimelate ligase